MSDRVDHKQMIAIGEEVKIATGREARDNKAISIKATANKHP
jgi:hypothetical protein